MTESFAQPVVTMIVEQPGRTGGILLQRRTKEEREPLKSLWELPQGRLREGESLAHCASRELQEETGLELSILNRKIETSTILGELLESLQVITVVETGQHSYLAICVVCSAEGTLRSSDESSDPQWFSRNQVLDLVANRLVFPLNVPMLLAYFAL